VLNASTGEEGECEEWVRMMFNEIECLGEMRMLKERLAEAALKFTSTHDDKLLG